MIETVSAAQARRIALAAQGFGRRRPDTVGTRGLTALLTRIHLLQLDSVNVFERSHYLPVFARLGAYDKAALDRLTFAPAGRYLEYWAHEAAIIPRRDWPLFRWRMDRFRDTALGDPDSWANANRTMLEWLRAELAGGRALAASEIEHESGKGRGGWWGWSDVKRGLETLFRWGEVVSAGRTRFERTYALAETALDAELWEAHVPEPEAVRELVRRSAAAHGIGTVGDLADYYRLKKAPARQAIQELEDAGELLPVTVRGVDRGGKPERMWLHRDARVPRRIRTAALLSPFDPVVWHRERALRTFDFHYRIEIYTPAAKRSYGYYVLPVLLDEAIVGRVDLKNDRKAGILRVQSAWAEPGAPDETAERVAALLREAAAWQGLSEIVVADRGTLSAPLRGELGA